MLALLSEWWPSAPCVHGAHLEATQRSAGGPWARNGGASAARDRDGEKRKECWSVAGDSNRAGECAAHAVSAARASHSLEPSGACFPEWPSPRWTRPPF